MNNAVVSQEGTPRDLYEAPANAFVADIIGEANLFDCEILGVTDGEAEIRLGGLTRRLPARGPAPGAAKLAVRPNRILLERPRRPEYHRWRRRQGDLCRQSCRVHRHHRSRRNLRPLFGDRHSLCPRPGRRGELRSDRSGPVLLTA
jgi:ABC-type Fe3+/spermidine/putrescine transport system ATPase subunit